MSQQTVVCDECGLDVLAESINTYLPDTGLNIPFRTMGYYGGFTDSDPWEEVNVDEVFSVCHACVLKMLDAMPGLAEKIFARYGATLHQTINADGTPCCRYCYIPKETNQGETE